MIILLIIACIFFGACFGYLLGVADQLEDRR